LKALLNMAGACGQERGREEVLWRIVQRFPKEKWAPGELHKLCAKDGNTVGLNRLYELIAKYDSKNWVAMNNFAATSMLLELNLVKAHEVALQLYREKPQEPVVASTYAYSLHLQGRTREALAVLEKCPRQALDDPGVALYYGVLLSADGRTNEATRFLNIARNGELLPEERKMVR
jgi:Flp pilus assembly protein TadD